jgi:predicted DCC family thiol-disulfide oxidoreductase YuxK
MTLASDFEGFFFRRISASGFGLMRIGWACTALFYMLLELGDIARYYSDSGFLPRTLTALALRGSYRFSLLDYVGDPALILGMYLVLVVALICMAVGLWPRLSTIVSVLLLFSFHERNFYMLTGGDTVLRLTGFLLMIAPGISAFSIKRLREQWRHWKKSGTFLEPIMQSIWPYRLLLWQLIVLYVSSGWYKLLGNTWMQGSAPAIAFHHDHFSRFSGIGIDTLSVFSPLIAGSVLLFEFAWVLLLLPRFFTYTIPWVRTPSYKRCLLLCGLAFHGGIFLVLDAGSFPIVMMVAYLGLLTEEDFAALRNWFNREWKGKIAVLYDGQCGLCRRSIFGVTLLDHVRRIEPVDFQNESKRIEVAPEVSYRELDRAMHVKFPSGRTLKGFYAFRALAWNLPALFIFAPFLYIPGVPWIGERVYQRVAAMRDKCAHGDCKR